MDKHAEAGKCTTHAFYASSENNINILWGHALGIFLPDYVLFEILWVQTLNIFTFSEESIYLY